MDKVKTPVRYDADAQIVWTADNVHLCDIRGYGYLTGTGGLHLSDKLADAIQDSWGRQIANALNTAADQSRVIEGLIEGLKHYADESFWDDPHPDLRYGEGTQYNFEDEIAGQMPGYQVAQAVIAEAQRILEGK